MSLQSKGRRARNVSTAGTEFATEGTTLALHRAGSPNPEAQLSGRSTAGICNLGFVVQDLDAFHQTVQAKGVRCLQPPKTEEFGRLALYADPDGLPLSVGGAPKKG